jgi:plastocyanin
LNKVEKNGGLMRFPTTIFRSIAVLAITASVAAPTGVWAEDGHGRGRGSDDGVVELRQGADDVLIGQSDDRGVDDDVAATALPATVAQPGAVALTVMDGPSQRDWTYAPAQVTTTVGTTLTWTNTGAQDHTVTSDDRTTFDSKNLAPAGTFGFTPTVGGTYGYHCAYHPWMKATITVTSS